MDDDEEITSEEDEVIQARSSRLLALVDDAGDAAEPSSVAERVPRRRVIDPVMAPDVFSANTGKRLTVADLLGRRSSVDAKRALLEKRLARVDRARAIAAPVPRVVEERAERQVGYHKASEAVSDWQEAVQHVRNVETLTLPLNAPVTEKPSLSRLAGASMGAMTELEREIAEALKASGLASEADIRAREKADLQAAVADPKQAAARQKELAKLRALLFFEEEKQKRIKRIKSKTFRKLKKRREHRAAEDRMKVDEEFAREMEEKTALARAEERMSLRHKNTSKFMRTLKRNHDGKGIAEALSAGAFAQPSSSDEDELTMAQRLVDDVENDKAPTEGVFALKFMQRAHEQSRERAKGDAQALLQSLTGASSSSSSKAAASRSGGVQFAGKVKLGQDLEAATHAPAKPLFDAPRNVGDARASDDDDDSEDEDAPQPATAAAAAAAASDDNPWLASAASSARRTGPVSEAIRVEAALEHLPATEANEENERLVKRAFAHAGVVEDEFAEERDGAAIEHAADAAASADLPGWGSWAGTGAPVKRQRAKAKVVTKLAQQANVPGLKNVIVSERAVKAAVKYNVESVPYPFTSAEQYERALATPLGADWNTHAVHASRVRPATVLKLGRIIDPLAWAASANKKRSFEKAAEPATVLPPKKKRSKMGADRTTRKL